VLFRIGVSDGHRYSELLTRHVDPRRVHEDRGWLPVTLDLSAWGGRQVELILNTNSSPPGARADARNDLSYWGAPIIRTYPP
jgi:hypothetical protein